MRSTLSERELKLLHDVDATLEKKQRLLQTQLEYIRDNDGSNGGATELVADPDMKLELQRQELLRTLTTSGWVMGATTDNKEELEVQERERKRRELARQQFLTVERLKQITVHERECATKREDSVRLTNEVHSEIAQINQRAAKVEAELADAKPMMEAARKLVSSIEKRQLDEIRVLKKPPAVVELVCSAVVITLGNDIQNWRDIQKAMAKSTFIKEMLQFDTMRLKKKTREEVAKYLKREDFNEDRANKASKVAGPLVRWVKSQVRYSELLDIQTRISVALSQIVANAETTKADIRATFLLMRSTLSERELKLLHDVDATLEKKQRLLQTQLEYIRDNDGSNGGATELVADPDMKLELQRQELLRTLTTSGWVMGATTDNKEELEVQERERKRRELARQQFLTVERLKQITVHERECATKREDSVRLTNEVHSEIAQINQRAAKVEAELADAKPMMEAARKLVSSIEKRQLDEIRVLKKPPAVVELVCSAVVITLGNDIQNWRDIQKAMAKSTFIKEMLQFDTMRLKKKTREEVAKYLKREDFNEDRANKASKVAGPLVRWVKSQVRYSELLDIVRPMQKEIRVLKKRLEKKQKQLTGVVKLVGGLEQKIEQARRDIKEMVENMIKLQDEYDLDTEGEEKKVAISDKIESHNRMYNTPISL